MIKRVLWTALIVFVILLIIFWLVTGGWGAVARTARSLMNPFDFFIGKSPSGSFIRLPWQPAESPTRGPDISGYAEEADTQNASAGADEQVSMPSTVLPQSQTQKFSNPSPYVGRVQITSNTATESSPALEYIEITASGSNAAPIPVSFWTLQSSVTGTSASIPQGAPFFVLGAVNNVEPIYLEPGASAIITTAASPLGVSFRESMCTGYLSELQSFTPELSRACPTPSDALPMSADNLRTYGSSCFDYFRSLQPCHFPTSLPSDLEAACRSFIASTMSYNGCANTNRSNPVFALPTWRAYLVFTAERWSNTHDVIQLLDAEGKTVDVLTY
ncbi:hypothetical protein A2763_02745 [Candidatus Kaiserbacteria bacterium RIFCSPHIGHO2_01_FULL_54_36]|uniref:LTD domain-containing protein n=1 Tax=Candidatus Kaiserbacteria bacterium RIFCSPHIGHO2_01_FULL_54_36 TaxID=1798482 RepID=A0A1F6CPC7_9BACT|nr:MAG: hypothetical protein A2763_02745 [Candidatus Kaiserbacteria bacterium RIFCSPHIGHO2_01_FULL_54_36]OGG75235.1 MAG: hypothetical protein A3A41_03885 [Candidatus Kaiserbacteria bacterium RIFCSPLOWO2_01_FULL_54_22]